MLSKPCALTNWLRAVPVLLASALPEKTISERCMVKNVFLVSLSRPNN